ncbi:MAG: hypothetical protein DMG38_14910 [Acidobacteria bacterium]|nr:MAG: hypothetical protein DMG38_14910 [Acidobacteriota bacterium]
MRDNTTSFASFQFARGGHGDARPSGRPSATNSLEFAPFRRFFCWTLSLVTATLVFQAVAPSRAQENQGAGSASADLAQSRWQRKES